MTIQVTCSNRDTYTHGSVIFEAVPKNRPELPHLGPKNGLKLATSPHFRLSLRNTLLKVGEKRQIQAVFSPQVGQIFQKRLFK